MRLVAIPALATLALFVLLPPYFLAAAFGPAAPLRVARLWHAIVVRLIGVRITVTGAPALQGPVLILSNHVSWLDILVLASLLPASFVAKREVAGWPVVGWLARLQRCIFVDRQRRSSAARQATELAARLASGSVVVLFPEGTSSDGAHVLPFRSALVGAAQWAISGDGLPATVQPVAIAYTGTLGLPLGARNRPSIAWYGDMMLGPHLRRILATGAVDVHVVFGPVLPAFGAGRKEVAARAALWVRRAVMEINRGRQPTLAPP